MEIPIQNSEAVGCVIFERAVLQSHYGSFAFLTSQTLSGVWIYAGYTAGLLQCLVIDSCVHVDELLVGS